MWLNLNKNSPFLSVVFLTLNQIGDVCLLLIMSSSLAVLMNESGLHDYDLVKKNVHVEGTSFLERRINQLEKLSPAISIIVYELEWPQGNGNVCYF